ncbi:unnamed protein product [Zymoseptoria tritici ST99CH_1E4]|uniref:Uncharacterized protein n=1 Tax=Zymoseptoria tritici ST99CH_1E4 TaxID=1276532 RepID=A0A2H1GHB7_ZYMTR|nr:unnamed protein product [Zymoseptoria tritici ST99CH_1E4]
MQFLAISTLAMLFAAAFAAPVPVPGVRLTHRLLCTATDPNVATTGQIGGQKRRLFARIMRREWWIGNDPGHKGGPALTSRTSNTPAGSDACLPGSCEGGGGTGGDPGHKGGPTSTL